MTGRILFGVLLIGWCASCSEEEPIPPIGDPDPPQNQPKFCQVGEMEYRDQNDQITGIREFKYDIRQSNRLEDITIVEGFDLTPITVRFSLQYDGGSEDISPSQLNEIFGGDIVATTTFRYDGSGNLTEFMHSGLAEPFVAPPEFHVFTYEDSELANDSINARIIVFDINRLTRDWIDVLPAQFTTGGKRIVRFENQTFRGEMIYACQFRYDPSGYLSQIECRSAEGLLTEVWDFTYENDRLVEAFRQEPNFRALTNYEYDDAGKPLTVVSTTDGFFNWTARYFYSCL